MLGKIRAMSLRAARPKRPMLILGQGALARPDGAAVLAAAWKLAEATGMLKPDWHGFNVLHTAASRVGALDLGFLPGPRGTGLAGMLGGGVDLLWLLGADEFDTVADRRQYVRRLPGPPRRPRRRASPT